MRTILLTISLIAVAAAWLCERARPSLLCGFDCRDACWWAAEAHSYADLRRCSRCRRLSVRPAACTQSVARRSYHVANVGIDATSAWGLS